MTVGAVAARSVRVPRLINSALRQAVVGHDDVAHVAWIRRSFPIRSPLLAAIGHSLVRAALGLMASASGEPTLENAASIHSDCELTEAAPLRKGAEVGAGNPRCFRRSFELSRVASVRVARQDASSTANLGSDE